MLHVENKTKYEKYEIKTCSKRPGQIKDLIFVLFIIFVCQVIF